MKENKDRYKKNKTAWNTKIKKWQKTEEIFRNTKDNYTKNHKKQKKLTKNGFKNAQKR